MSGTDAIQIYGAVDFGLYGPSKTDWQNRIRTIRIMNDVSGWEFFADGEVQPYEQIENYQKRKIVDRFTPEMLEFNCAALGIDLFNSDFYGGSSLLARIKRSKPPAITMSIAEVRSALVAAPVGRLGYVPALR